MTQVVDDSLEAGREAARRHAWRDVYELLRQADKDGELTTRGSCGRWTRNLSPPDVRIGVHTGGAFQKDDDDFAGQGVHMAARIGALAGGGEILVSRESVDGGSRFSLSDPRSEKLKGFDDPVELVAVKWR
jgi:class 3 adenylate cyclase